MKKTIFLSVSFVTLGVITGLYAQATTGTSIIDKMKAVAHSFTLSSTLNPTDTGLTSDPVKGKKTGDILTAGEYNRILELVSEGSTGGGGSGWVDVPLSDTNPFDQQCMYRFVMQGQTYYAETVHEDRLYWINVMYFAKANKSVLVGGIAPFTVATKIEKLCGGGGTTSAGLALYKCTNAQSLDTTNAPCYGASRNGGAGTNQYRVVSCSNTDASGTYTAGGLLNFGDFIANKWSFHINNSNIACIDGTVLVMDIQGGGSTSTASSSWVDVPLTDTAAYDSANCQYRFKLTGPAYNTAQGFSADGYYNAYYTTAGLIKGDSGIFIKSSSKNIVYVIDNSNGAIVEVTSAWGWRPTKIEKRCN